MKKDLFQGRIFSVAIETHALPDGGRAAFEMVRHPGGAAVLPIAADGRLLLIRQFRPAAGGMVVEIPAGRLDPGEEPLTCARRELIEEVGLEAGELEPCGSLLSSVGFCDERIHLFLARSLRQVPCRREADEFITPFWVDLPAALRMLDAGEIPDAKTQVVLLAHARRCGGH